MKRRQKTAKKRSRYAGEGDNNLLTEDLSEEAETKLSVSYLNSADGFFYYGTEASAERVKYADLTITGDAISWTPPKESELGNLEDAGYIVGVTGNKFGTATITYQGSSVQVEVVLPGNAFYSADERTVENYLGKDGCTLPFTGEKVDENGKPYEVYYYLRSSNHPLTGVEL